MFLKFKINVKIYDEQHIKILCLLGPNVLTLLLLVTTWYLEAVLIICL